MDKLYQVIYADPPWRYEHCKTNNRQIENHYPTMTLNDIKSLNVPSDPNGCVLYLWATAPKMEEALTVMQAWGFSYRSQAIWDKQRIGMGYWFRIQHELLLVGVKGKFSPPGPSDRVSSLFSIKRGRHSEKPAEIRNLIAAWYPNVERLEMFARETSPGWDVFGNEVTQSISLSADEDCEHDIARLIDRGCAKYYYCFACDTWLDPVTMGPVEEPEGEQVA